MTLRTGNPDVRFRPRPLEGVALNEQREPEFLLLDGQQRMTSLYLALKYDGPVPTRDARGKDLYRRYYADIAECLNAHVDREDAIVGLPADGIVRNFRGEVLLDVSTREKEIAAGLFPLWIVLDFAETMGWQMSYLQEGPGEASARLEIWKEFNQAVITPFVQYQVPTIQLAKSTPKEAVCQVFEKVNTGGVSLTVFELLTATYAAENFNLRDDWKARKERFKNYSALQRFEATDFLQILTLLATYDRRQRVLATDPNAEQAPPVSCKRRDILRLERGEYELWADSATKALERVVPFLHAEHVFAARDLPYATQLIPLCAVFVVLGDQAESHGVRQRLRQWYWCGVFGEMYGGSTETRFAYDVPDLIEWAVGGDREPRTITEAQFQAERLLTLRSRNSAAYKGLYALQMKRGGRDFRTGEAIDVHAYFDDAIDIHHIFPQRWCRENGIADGVMNSVVNKTAIDAHTNRRIGGNAPSRYVARLESQDGIDHAEFDAILQSHDIDPISLRQDDFPQFFDRRFERLLKQIEEAMGKSVNRSADRADNPFAEIEDDPARASASVASLIQGGESKVVEFKSTGRRNLFTNDKDVAIEWAVVKSIAGFMNAHGGTLLVGVSDDEEIVGIERDYAFLRKDDRDGWELWVTGLISAALGTIAASELAVSFAEMAGGTVSRIDVGPASKPVFAMPSKGERKEQFLVRINNSTQELVGHDALDYQQKRWPS